MSYNKKSFLSGLSAGMVLGGVSTVTGGGATIISGPAVPTAEQGSDGNLYVQTWPAVQLPPDATLLDYIESSGTQWIDTGIPARTHLQCEFDVQCMLNSGDQQILGGAGGPNSVVYLGYNWGSAYRSYYINWGSWHDVSNVVDTNRHLIVSHSENQNNYLSRDGVILWSNAVSTPVTTGAENLNLFRRPTGAYYASVRLYGLKIYDLLNDGELLRNFVPVLDGNGVACLFDGVSESYFYNSGTGAFSVGATTRIGEILAAFAKKGGAWINLIGANINDIP